MCEKTPIYKNLAKEIMRQIIRGDLVPGHKLPTLRDMAAKHDVHYHTIRLAYKELESDGFVRSARRGGTIICSPGEQHNTVFAVFPFEHESNSLFHRSLHAIQDVMQTQKGISVESINTGSLKNPELAALKRIAGLKRSGLIIFPGMAPASNAEIKKLISNGAPVVLVDRRFDQFPTWNVASDNYDGGRLAARALIRSGCRRMAIVYQEQFSSTRERRDGFLDALQEADLSPAPGCIRLMTLEEVNSVSATEALLRLSPRPDGIFYTNDYGALQGIHRMHERGIAIPNEIAVVGFDDMEAAALCYPALTTIRQDTYEIGRQAALLWLEQLTLPPVERKKERTIKVPVGLVERFTTNHMA